MAQPDPERATNGADETTTDETITDDGEGRHVADAPVDGADTAAHAVPVDASAEERAAEERAAEERAAEERAADERLERERAEHAEAVEDRGDTRVQPAVVPAPTEQQPVLQPAEESAPAAPKRESNRLVGTAWVLLAAGLFQVVYFGLIAALIALLAAPQVAGGQLGQVVGSQLGQYFATPFAWLPVLLFFLLFELTVLLFNRAGRFVYVVASLIVGIVTYVASVLLISILVRGSVGDASTLEQTFLIPQFVLIGLVAREVMLWTGVAIGARGSRVRRRNRAAQQSYRAELAEH